MSTGTRHRHRQPWVVARIAPLAVLGTVLASSATATDWYVAPPPLGDDANTCRTATLPCATIASAVARSGSGDAVHLASGVYAENLLITHGLTVSGADSASTIVDGGGRGPVFRVHSWVFAQDQLFYEPVTLTRLTVRHGQACAGTAPPCQLTPLGNSDLGLVGGVYSHRYVPLILDDVVVSDNTGGDGGVYGAAGGVLALGPLTLVHTTVRGNRAGSVVAQGPVAGGVLAAPMVAPGEAATGLVLEDSRILDNVAGHGLAATGAAGGIFVQGNVVTIQGVWSEIARNLAGDRGAGGLYVAGGQIDADFGGLSVRDNVAGSGGVDAPAAGGAIFDGARARVRNLEVSRNRAGDGPGLVAPLGPGVAGGVVAMGTDVELRGLVLHDNEAGAGGAGGLWAAGDVVEAAQLSATANQAGPGGTGGVVLDGAGARLENATVSGNRAADGGVGGVFAYPAPRLSFVTVAGNDGGPRGSGGIGGAPTLANSIVSGNTGGAGTDCAPPPGFGLPGTDGYNLIGDAQGCAFPGGLAPTDRAGVPSRLLPPAREPGGTWVLGLDFGSPALDAASPDCLDAGGSALAADQRGIARPLGGICDIGAFEAAPQDNHPPVADAGGPYSSVCKNKVLGILLDGIGSFDPDPGDELAYRWTTTCPGQILNPTNVVAQTSFACHSCVDLDCQVTLTVTDLFGVSASAQATVKSAVVTTCATCLDPILLVKGQASDEVEVTTNADWSQCELVRAEDQLFRAPDVVQPDADNTVPVEPSARLVFFTLAGNDGEWAGPGDPDHAGGSGMSSPLGLLREETGGDFRRGVEAFGSGEHRRAVEALSRSLAEGGPEAPWACQQLIQSHCQRGEADVVEAGLSRVLPPDSPLLWWGRGYLYRRSGRTSEARTWLVRAASAEPPVWPARLERSALLHAEGDRDGAIRLLAECLEHFESVRDEWGVASVFAQRASQAIEEGRYPEAIKLADTAIELRQHCGDHFGLGVAHQLRGKACYLLADYVGAIRAYRAALQVHWPGRHLLEAGVHYNNLGLCYRDLSDPARAADFFRTARRVFRRIGDRLREAAVLANLAHACRQLGDLRACERHFEAALALLAGQSMPDAHGIALTELAEAQTRRGRPERALERLRHEGRELWHRLRPRTRAGLLLEEARALVRAGEPRQALTVAGRALDMSRRIKGPVRSRLVPLLSAETVLGQSCLAAGDRARAESVLRRACRRIGEFLAGQPSQEVRMGFVETWREANDNLVRCLLDGSAAGARRAFAAAARAKARELQVAAEPVGDAGAADTPWEAIELEYRLLMTSRNLGRREQRRMRELRHLLLDSSVSPGAVAASARRESGPGLRRLGQSLGPGMALVEFHVSEQTTLAFVLHGGQLEVLDLGWSASRVEREVERVLASLVRAAGEPDPRADLDDFDLSAAFRLFGALVRPVLRALPEEARRLLIVPDGPLHALPFELLPTAPEPPLRPGLPPLARFAAQSFLLDTHVISYARSSALIQPCTRPAASRPPRLIALAYTPTGDTVIQMPEGPVRVAPLLGVEAEVDAIAHCFGERRVLVGSQARASAWEDLVPGCDVVHVAAHAIADSRAAGLSGVIVAPEGESGERMGFLSAERIRRVPLEARLVTLSACNSASGFLRAREGQMGLSRAFLEAGASAVLASQWAVDDSATRDLMLAFYRRLSGGQEPATALARAKRELRETVDRRLFAERAHPFFWAAFTLVDHAPGRARRRERGRR